MILPKSKTIARWITRGLGSVFENFQEQIDFESPIVTTVELQSPINVEIDFKSPISVEVDLNSKLE